MSCHARRRRSGLGRWGRWSSPPAGMSRGAWRIDSMTEACPSCRRRGPEGNKLWLAKCFIKPGPPAAPAIGRPRREAKRLDELDTQDDWAPCAAGGGESAAAPPGRARHLERRAGCCRRVDPAIGTALGDDRRRPPRRWTSALASPARAGCVELRVRRDRLGNACCRL